MTAVCASAPCNQTAFNSAAATLSTACASDVAAYGFNSTTANATLVQVFQAYPIVRELVCTKTVKPSKVNSTVVDESSYKLNTTNGTFCVSNLLEQVEEIAGFNLSVTNLVDVGMDVYNGNYSAVSNFTKLPPTALCQDCIFAGADIIAQSYPQVWNYTISSGSSANSSNTTTTTIAGFLNGTCKAEGLNVTFNGTLPSSIAIPVNGSDYPFKLSSTNYTYTPGPNAVSPPSLFNSSASRSAVLGSATASIAQVASSASSAVATAAKRDVTAAKKRWFGA